MQTQVLGLSVDSVPCLKAWADSLGGIMYPLLSDFYPHGKVAESFGVLRPEGYTERAIFIIDKDGVIRYVDVHEIGEQPDNDELFRALKDVDPDAAAAFEAAQPEPAAEPDADVVVYCTPWCSDCRKARDYLEQKQIDYVEVDISRDRTAAQRVKGWTGGKEITPTFTIKGEVVVNFDQEKLDAMV